VLAAAGSRTDTRTAEEPAPAARVSEAPVSEPLVAPGRTGIFLTGALLELDGLDATLTRVVAQALSGSEKSTQGTSDGRYVLEITELVRQAQRRNAALYVAATHPAGRWVKLEVPLSDAVLTASEYDVTEVPLDLALQPRTAILGRVDGSYEEGTAQVGLVKSTLEDGKLEREVIDKIYCDSEGEFALYPSAAGDYLVVATAPGLLPSSAEVRIEDGEVEDDVVLVLSGPGVSIAGVVRVPFEARMDRWRVEALFMGGGHAWEGVNLDTLGNFSGRGTIGPDGAFRISGLSAGRYKLGLWPTVSMGPSASPYCEVILPFDNFVGALEVEAPAQGVEVGSTYGRTRVAIHAPEASDGVKFTLEGDLATQQVIVRGPAVEVIADSRLSFACQASAAGMQSARVDLPANTRAVDEQVELVLTPMEGLSTLELEWTMPAGMSQPAHVRAHWRSGNRGGQWGAEAGASKCHFEHLEPGRYRIHLEPSGKDTWDLSTSLLCAVPFEVELVPGRVTRARVDWVVGGRARFVPERGLESAERASARVQILSVAGEAQPVSFEQREFVDGTLTTSSYEGQMLLSGASECRPNLPAGRYEFVLDSSSAGPELRVPFTIVAGETVEVRVVVP
jgi:hypothetical protein